ncbi:unnamed protein product [Urochloa decumbens]|uniref:Uncharacterized protein n=1 Tax=Urochloa decumbens TaxID=240449 RepID=A0ABC9E2W8_9POAL
MEASPPKPHDEIRDEAAATAAAAKGGGGVLGGALMRQLIDLVVVMCSRLQAMALFLLWGCLGILGSLRQLIELEVVPILQTAALFLSQGCSGGIGALQQLIEPEDRRLQAATFLLAFGGSTMLNGAALNRSVNPENLLVGFVLVTLGVAISILTLSGGEAGRAADRMERFLRGFF